MRGVLALFEGVATGAADGYARIAGRPAATLLHLGPGLGQRPGQPPQRPPGPQPGGQHRRRPRPHPPPLRRPAPVGHRDRGPQRLPVRPHHGVHRAGRAATPATPWPPPTGPPGSVATLILPADVSWSEGGWPSGRRRGWRTGPAAGAGARPDGARGGGRRPALGRAGGAASSAAGPAPGAALEAVADLAASTGAELLCETFPARLDRGAGRPPVERLGLPGRVRHHAARRHPPPGPGRRASRRSRSSPTRASPATWCPRAAPSTRWPARPTTWPPAVARWPTSAGGDAGAAPAPGGGRRPACPPGALTAQTVCQALGALLPEGAIVSDEGNTSGLFAPGATAGAPPHDWLCLTGGAIGQGLPVAVGAAVAAPDRRVVALEADGSALYTLQSWWTMAREGLDVTTVILNNHSYAVLNMELDRVGAERPGPRARDMLDLGRPDHRLRAAGPGPRAARHPGRRPPRSSPTSWPGRWPPRGRAWSRPSSLPCCRRSGRPPAPGGRFRPPLPG